MYMLLLNILLQEQSINSQIQENRMPYAIGFPLISDKMAASPPTYAIHNLMKLYMTNAIYIHTQKNKTK